MAAAQERLRDRGLLHGDQLSDAGRTLREQLEQATDAAVAPMVATLGDRREAVVEQCSTWCAAIVERGWFPPDGVKRAAG